MQNMRNVFVQCDCLNNVSDNSGINNVTESNKNCIKRRKGNSESAKNVTSNKNCC